MLMIMQNGTMTVTLPEREFSTAELAEASGTPVTTLRLYQQRGLLDPPRRRGRNAVYGPSHLERLAVIRKLQQRGYSLAAIGDVTRNDQHVVGQVVDLEVPALAATPATMSLLELMQSLPSADFSLETIHRAERLGVLIIDGPTVTITQPAFLEAGAALTTMGVPTERIFDAYEDLQARVREIAAAFAVLFDQNVLPDVEHADLQTVGEQLETLTRTAISVVGAELRRALRDVAVERINAIAGAPRA